MAEKRTPAGRYIKLGQFPDTVNAFVPDPRARFDGAKTLSVEEGRVLRKPGSSRRPYLLCMRRSTI